tara:strand:- start:2446 stop:3351 length:906 start_codon:yes stop_codon:yes gene_type:complete
MEEEKNPVLEEIEKEIEETKARNTGEFEIEIADEPPETEQKEKVEKAPEPEKAPTAEYGAKVQRRIRTLIKEKKEAEELAQKQAQESADLKARLVKLESQSQQNVNKDFQTQYDQTKQALHTAVEEGDTKAQVEFSEQLADMRARIRVADLQKQQAQQLQQPRIQQPVQQTTPAPDKAMSWWKENDWFNAKGFEKETAMARAIDVQLDLEGFDKNSSDYYINLNSRLQKIYPELISSDNVTQPKTRAKSSNIVTPSTGGSSYKGNRVRMTQDQLRMARELGINDEAGLKKYAQEIQKSQRS